MDAKAKKAKKIRDEVAELHCKLRMRKEAQVNWVTNDIKKK